MAERAGPRARLISGILFCDKAASALDPETTRDVLRLLSELNRTPGLTIVLVTHEMNVARQVCDCVAVLRAGRW